MSRKSGAIASALAGWKKPTAFIVVGTGTTKSSLTATIMHCTPALLPQSSNARRTASSVDS